MITDNHHKKIVKKNTEHKYLIKKHKLNLHKKTLHSLHKFNKIVTREQHYWINVIGYCMNITSPRHT